MDATLSGLLGGIVGAVLGGLVVIWATKQQIRVLLAQTSGSVHERLYAQNLEIMRFLADHPQLYPYFFANKAISQAMGEMERLQILSTADMVVGFLDLVAVQVQELPNELRPNWENVILDQYHASAVVREHIHAHARWYSSSVLKHVSSEAPPDPPAHRDP